MKHGINLTKVYEARIEEPYIADSSDIFNPYSSHGWRVMLTMGYDSNGNPIVNMIERNSEEDCIELLKEIGLYIIY